ncbi:MAG: hypothetical protein ACLVEV_06225 [Lachnospiraceae bacterium]
MKALKDTIHSHNRKLFALVLLGLMVLFTFSLPALADDDVKPSKILAAGKKTITVTAGSEFHLRVRTRPYDADEDFLKWSITSGSKYVRFDDDDRSDDEIELRARKKGTAKITCSIRGTKKKVTFTVKVREAKTPQKKIKIYGPATRTVESGDDFELKIKKYRGLKDRYLQWSIQDPDVIRFNDDDRRDDEVEFYAKKAGTTKISCKNTQTGQTVTFTVKVVRGQDDWDDRYDHDDHDDWDDRYDHDDHDDWD